MDLNQGLVGKEYLIKDVKTIDEEMDAFLFSLGCYKGQPITIISKLRSGVIVAIKDARYTIDKQLAKCILI